MRHEEAGAHSEQIAEMVGIEFSSSVCEKPSPLACMMCTTHVPNADHLNPSLTCSLPLLPDIDLIPEMNILFSSTHTLRTPCLAFYYHSANSTLKLGCVAGQVCLAFIPVPLNR